MSRARAAFAITSVVVVLGIVTVTPTTEESAAELQGEAVTVYSSLPLSGVSRPQAVAMVRGARLALEERGGAAGAHPVRYVSLNDATARPGAWTPVQTERNARRASKTRPPSDTSANSIPAPVRYRCRS
jgi:ABC-type branched-subunit amino acid transport system substrate-binding protein